MSNLAKGEGRHVYFPAGYGAATVQHGPASDETDHLTFFRDVAGGFEESWPGVQPDPYADGHSPWRLPVEHLNVNSCILYCLEANADIYNLSSMTGPILVSHPYHTCRRAVLQCTKRQREY